MQNIINLFIHIFIVLFICACSTTGVHIPIVGDSPRIEDKTIIKKDFYYQLEIHYPYFSKCKTRIACEVANKKIEQFINENKTDFEGEDLLEKKEMVSDFSKELEGQSDINKVFLLGITYNVFNDGDYVSIQFTIKRYDVGAHETITYSSFNYDFLNNQEIELRHAIKWNDHFKLENLNEILGNKFLEGAKDGTKTNGIDIEKCFTSVPIIDESFANFNFNSKNFIFSFAPYELGPYNCGSAIITLPKEGIPNMFEKKLDGLKDLKNIL